MVLVAAVGALTVEFGRVSQDQRKAQIATNQAAVAAAGDLMRAEGVAAAAVSGTRMAGNTEMIVVRGRYRNDPLLPKEQRFQPDPVNANAARVTVRTEAPLHVGRLFTGAPSYSIAAEATAQNTAFGAIAIGGRTLALQDGLLNPILSDLLGARIALGSADYKALSATQIDLFRYLQALASEMSLTSASYDRVPGKRSRPPARLPRSRRLPAPTTERKRRPARRSTPSPPRPRAVRASWSSPGCSRPDPTATRW